MSKLVAAEIMQPGTAEMVRRASVHPVLSKQVGKAVRGVKISTMEVTNPRRLGAVLALLVVVIVVVVVVVIKPFSSSPTPQTQPAAPGRISIGPAARPPAAVTSLLQTTNNARFVIISSRGTRRELVKGLGTATMMGGKLQMLATVQATWARNGSCYEKLPATAMMDSAVQTEFFIPLSNTQYHVTDQGGNTQVNWQIPQPPGTTIRAPAGSFVANSQGQITSATATNAGQTDRYTITYPTTLTLPAPPTNICTTTAPIPQTPPTTG